MSSPGAESKTRESAAWNTTSVFRGSPPVRAVERLGLAVIAKNGVQRWRRVWVFVRVEREPTTEPADSTGDHSDK